MIPKDTIQLASGSYPRSRAASVVFDKQPPNSPFGAFAKAIEVIWENVEKQEDTRKLTATQLDLAVGILADAFFKMVEAITR